MTGRSRLKLKQTRESLVEKLTSVLRDAAGEVLADALEESPTTGAKPVSRVPSKLRDSMHAGVQGI